MREPIAPRSAAGARFRRSATALVTAALLSVTVSACTDDKPHRPEAASPSQPATAPVMAPMTVTVARVAGKLKPGQRRRLATAVKRPLREYVDDAFLGDYPRTDFTKAFSVFSRGARPMAKKDRALLTGQSFGKAQEVTASRLAVRLSVFAPHGRVGGATARIRFRFTADHRPVSVTGRLLLSKDKGRWRIFGYDVARSDLAGGDS